jgi:hypothetical protein
VVSDNNQYSVTDLVQNEQQKHLKIADKVIAEHGHLIAPNGEKSNLNKQQWAQVRTPQFKAWFGDFEQTNQEPVPVTEITGAEITGATPTETRNNAKAYIEELIASLVELNGNSNIHNNRTGFDIGLTKKGVVHGFQHSGAPTVKAVAGIKSLIENAAKIATNPHEPVNENIKQVHTLVAPLSIDGELFSVKITAKEYWDGSVKLYDHQTLELKKPDGIYAPLSSDGKLGKRPASGNISIEQLLSAFNGENTKYLASKVVDANGEPILVSLVE